MSSNILFINVFQGLPTESWKISKLNEKFDLCDTYPPIVSVMVELNRTNILTD